MNLGLVKNPPITFFVKKKVVKESIGINIRRDLLVLNMCVFLLSEIGSDDALKNKSFVTFKNNSHKVNKKISVISSSLLERIKQTIRDVYAIAENKAVVIKWCDDFWMGKEVSRLFKSIEQTNLESLANQILHINFIERDKPVHKLMQWLCDSSLHYEYFDLIEKTDVYKIQDIIYEDALRCVKVLKG